jgi:hypothetical protein
VLAASLPCLPLSILRVVHSFAFVDGATRKPASITESLQLDGPSQCAAQVKEQVRTAGGKIGAFFMESGLSVGGVIIPPKRSDRPIFLRTADSVAFARLAMRVRYCQACARSSEDRVHTLGLCDARCGSQYAYTR